MDVVVRPNHQQLIADFAQLSDDAPDAELDAACLVSQALSPELDVAGITTQIARLTADCTSPDQPWRYLRELGFQGNGGDTALTGSALNDVLARRSGLPIALGVLLIHLARAQGHETWGVNFPGHFLVRVASTLIDPYEMTMISEAECLSRLAPAERRGAFARAPARLVALRMLNNLKYQYAATAHWSRALDMLDFQLALSPDDSSLLLERGDFWLRMGAVDAARRAFTAVLSDDSANPELRTLAQAQIEAIAGQYSTLH